MMIPLLFVLKLPNHSWNVRPVKYDLMKSTLTTWREEYLEESHEYKNTFEMIGWYATFKQPKCCFGLYHNYELRALAQVYKENDKVFLRSVITPNEEDTAGTILMYKILKFQEIEVDWNAIQQNARWYTAALFIKENE